MSHLKLSTQRDRDSRNRNIFLSKNEGEVSESKKIGKVYFKNGPFRPLFLYFRLFNTVDSKQMFNKFCR